MDPPPQSDDNRKAAMQSTSAGVMDVPPVSLDTTPTTTSSTTTAVDPSASSRSSSNSCIAEAKGNVSKVGELVDDVSSRETAIESTITTIATDIASDADAANAADTNREEDSPALIPIVHKEELASESQGGSKAAVDVHSNGHAPTAANGVVSSNTSEGMNIDGSGVILLPVATDTSLADASISNLPQQQQTDIRIENDDDDQDAATISALQANLQLVLSQKAEAENRARLAEHRNTELQNTVTSQAAELEQFQALQSNLEHQMTIRAEAENKARSAYQRVQQLESERILNLEELANLQKQIALARESKAARDREINEIRATKNELERQTMELTTRLNSTKKKEGVKLNIVEELEGELKVAQSEIAKTKMDLARSTAVKTTLEQNATFLVQSNKEKMDHLEQLLAREKRLNEDRKNKMSVFVEKKAEELRQAKEEYDSLQMELSQTNRSLVELNNRWKQLHTQWVQSQTKNRELSRDLNRTKKDSENLHKQGDSLEMKLSRSANETEEHKNKRLAAKHELMSVLRTLDGEREITAKLKDSIKFTFTPNVQNQQQVLSECLDEFETSLQKLSLRLGKPLPQQQQSPTDQSDNDDDPGNGVSSLSTLAMNGDVSAGAAHTDIGPFVEKLHHESNRVTRSVATMASNVDRLQALLRSSGDRTCFAVLSELVTTGNMASSPAMLADGQATSLPALGRSHRYGQVPGMTDNV